MTPRNIMRAAHAAGAAAIIAALSTTWLGQQYHAYTAIFTVAFVSLVAVAEERDAR